MSRIVYVNGDYVAEEDAKVSVFDRGFLFADGVYEVSSILQGKLIENTAHLIRLKRSMNELNMESPAESDEIEAIQKELIKRNNLQEGTLYLQVTRGAADRDFVYPEDTKPSLVMFTQAKKIIDSPVAKKGISVITTEDIRWQRRDIKTVGLLPACMAKMIAKHAGADDAWMIDQDGNITEGSSNNSYIVTENNTIVTRQLSSDILHGITRKAVLALAEELKLTIEERPYTPAEAIVAKEAFITSASTFVWPVVKIDGEKIGDGKPGPIAQRLRQVYIEKALASIQD